ncbi:MAG TPA: thioesterase family protein [Beijerinckiaceae bacterium]|nr:thioesterase family protein [Beijerinckiaceae bacterium]
MNLWLRMLWLALTARFRPRFDTPLGLSRLTLRVWPFDVDVNRHLNNGRYLTIADLGRADLFHRSGVWRQARAMGLFSTMLGVAIRFQKEIKPLRTFDLESRWVYWNERVAVMEHLFLIGAGEGRRVAAREFASCGFYDMKVRRFVDPGDLFRKAGAQGGSPPASEEILAFLKAQETLKQV